MENGSNCKHNMNAQKPKNIFIDGPVSPSFIGESIQKHGTETSIGAHSIFIGQVRADVTGQKKVAAIEYSAYEEMAIDQMHGFRELIFARHKLTCLHVYHSLGIVHAGEICLFVFASSAHRKAATEACSEIVEMIKKELPVWGKELFDDDSHQWKLNQ